MSRKLLGVIGMRLFTIFRWLVVVLCLLTAAAIVYAETTGTAVKPPVTTILDDQSILFSGSMVILLITVAITLVTSMVTAKNHMANTDIHPTSGNLQQTYATKTDCTAKHQSVDASFLRIHERFDDIKSDLAYIKGKLSGDN